MSGGIEHADKMNIHLAEAAAETNVALALGSMRITLEDQSGEASFKVGRYLTGQPLIANIGAAQIIGARERPDYCCEDDQEGQLRNGQYQSPQSDQESLSHRRK